ncbi:MAG: hypothetical protein ACMUIS_01435 [bacterium]
MTSLSSLFGIIVGSSHFEGGLVTLFARDQVRNALIQVLQPFSSGALLSLAIVHLLPLSLRMFPWSAVVLLGTIAGLMVLSEFNTPDRVLVLTPRWGQGFLLMVYSLSLGIVLGIPLPLGFRMVLIAAIVGIPVQFVQGVKRSVRKSGQRERGGMMRLVVTSLPIPLTVFVLQVLSPRLSSAHVGFLLSFASAVIFYQGMLEFRIPYPFSRSALKVLYFLTGVFLVYCL